ncbi:MAG: hypothetical protein JWM43_129 [Acidobacteriaceae bacterium]|nr:hypothetical protein [Acidobacteriaceae bacterium]
MSIPVEARIRAVNQQDLDALACPVCYATLVLQIPHILCTGCARRYPIVDGLPVLLTDRTL